MKVYDSGMSHRKRFFWPLLAACCAGAQPQTPAPPTFDVASVKVSPRPFLMIFPQRSVGRITWTTDLHYLIGYAYQLPLSRIAGPVPGSDHIYEIEATTDPGATEDRVRLMFQSLLRDRFKMVAHRETKEADGYALKVGKSGLKIKEAKDGEPPPPMPEWMGKGTAEASLNGRVVAQLPSAGVVAITGRRATMAQLSATLERSLGGFVTDETGLSDKYYLAFKFAQENHPEVDLPTIFPALQDLGLRLEKRKGPVEMLVVDHIEKTPTEN